MDKYCYDYPRPNITVDVIYKNPYRGILLIRRKNFPDAGKLACPGGHLESNERLLDCGKREFKEEVGFTPHNPFRLVGIFDKIERDPRDRYISVVYAVDWSPLDPQPIAGDDAAECIFMTTEALYDHIKLFGEDAILAIDHKEILGNALFGSFKDSNALEMEIIADYLIK